MVPTFPDEPKREYRRLVFKDGCLEGAVLVLDGKVTTEDAVLRAGQMLGVFPPLAGGSPRDRT